jgi:hypothetical protein
MWFIFRKLISKVFFSISITLYLIANFLDTIGVKILMGTSWKRSKEIVFEETKRVYNLVK